MKRRLVFFSFIILSLTVVASCGGSSSSSNFYPWDPTNTGTGTGSATDTSTGPVDAINFEDYFWPLHEDWKWTFDLNEWMEVDPVVVIGSDETYPLSWVAGGDSANRWYFTHDGNGTLLEVRFAFPPSVYFDFDNPLVWGKRAMVKDVTITTDATGTEFDFTTGNPTGNTYPFRLEVTYLGKEIVTVPAGTFTNCIKVSYKRYRDSTLVLDEIYWFSWHDGIVKNEIIGDRMLEVVSIQYPQ